MLAWQARKRQQKVPPRISDQQKLLRDYGLLSTFKELQKEQRVCHNNTAFSAGGRSRNERRRRRRSKAWQSIAEHS